MTTRRAFTGQALGAAAAFSVSCGRTAPAPRRPNILFCITDDQSYPHAGACGSSFIKTPGFDRVAGEGVLFNNAFVSTPSCCPSRGSVLTGQDFYRLREASMNHTVLPRGLDVYPDMLAAKGYHRGFTGKGWSPGNWRVAGRKFNPAGPEYNRHKLEAPGKYVSPFDYAANFEDFLNGKPKDAPFCFWAGFVEPHREFDDGIGVRNGKRLDDMRVPAFLPDVKEVRGDIADYAFEVEWQDRHLARILDMLEKRGELDHTFIVVTADNGMAFPRAKATLYDYGTRMPLAVRWGDRVKAGRVVDDFVSFRDFAPTFIEAAGLPVPPQMTGRSLLPLLESPKSGQVEAARDHAVFGIERHFPGSRPNGAGYPCRAIRTRDYLYIRNLEPDANPVGDNPGPVWPNDDPTGGYGDTDGGPSKTVLCRDRQKHPELFRLAFGKRPAEEFFSIASDPFNIKNLAADPGHDAMKKQLSARLDTYLRQTEDPRAAGRGAEFDAVMKRYPVLGSNMETAGR